MRVVLTGGASDLAHLLAPALVRRGAEVLRLDIRAPAGRAGRFVEGSILDRPALGACMAGADCVVHIAAWHGIHAVTGQRDVYDFWDLNVTGTFNVLEAAARAGVRRVVYLSSTSIDEWPDVYGHTKRLGEQIVETYVARHGLRALSLRPRAFIPHWNRAVYASFSGWAQWYWPGAVHARDVARAAELAIDALMADQAPLYAALPVDGACPYSDAELAGWDAGGPGSSFRARFGRYEALARQHGLDPALRPTWLGHAEAERLIGYRPSYGHAELLEELERYGDAGPPAPSGDS